MSQKVRAIALYLPQFHPIPENDLWWGKGFTEWTNVGKAKKLFPGHYQPKVPTELGYYDLRVPESREAQAELARDAGVEGFAYWHYWFGNGRTLLERPFQEVLQTGKPDFPFCLAWANHSWYDKTWNKKGENKLLIEQRYDGEKDYRMHFNAVLPAFRDKRYICVDGCPVFLIFDPKAEALPAFMKCWRQLAEEHGFPGIFFIALSKNKSELQSLSQKGFDAISYDPISDFRYDHRHLKSLFLSLAHHLFFMPKVQSYSDYISYFKETFPVGKGLIPTVVPNFDHSPRSGRNGVVLVGATPERFGGLLEVASSPGYRNDQGLLIIRSWNEWGEGNYLEPDIKYGHAYIDEMKKVLHHD